MSPSESEDDTKKTGLQPEPLCLFCFPNKDDTPPDGYQDEHQKTYIEATSKDLPSKKEFLSAAVRRKMQHSTPRKPEPTAPPAAAPSTNLRAQPDKKSKRRSPSRRRLAEMMNSTDTSNESQERKKPQSYAEYKKNYHRQKTGRENVKRKKKDAGARGRDEIWLRRRKDTGMKGRRQAQEPVRHWKSYLLSNVKDDKVSQKAAPLPLIEVLETIKDAWPPNKTLTLESRAEEKKPEEMKTETSFLQFPQPLLNRRYSMPEEVMRKYSVTKERTSEESETNKTMPEITSPSSKEPDETLETEREIQAHGKKSEKPARPRRKSILRTEMFSKTIDEEDVRTGGYDASVSGKDTSSVYSKRERTKTERSFIVLSEVKPEVFKSSDEEQNVKKISKRPITRRVSVVDTTTKRVTQNEYYNQGKGIIKVKAMEKGSQTGECTCRSEKRISSTTASAKEESDESHSSKSLSSRSPEQLPKGEDESSDNLSSESDNYQCTCAELSSKETSSDMFASGKSTLSQSVSDKSESTQDSTVSINSVPTEGSSVSAESNSTSPELDPKTSAKETTTSPDHTPRTPRSRSRPFTRIIKETVFRPEESYKKRDVKLKEERRPLGFPKKCPIHTGEEFTSNGKDEEEYPSDSNNGYIPPRQQFPEDLYNLPDRNLDPNPLSYRSSDERKELELTLKKEKKNGKKKGDAKPLKHPPRRDSDDDSPANNPQGTNPHNRESRKDNNERDRSQGSRERKRNQRNNPKTSKRGHDYPEDMYNIPDLNQDCPSGRNPNCPVHPPKDESPVRSVRFESKCTDNRNCSTPIQNDPPVPKIDLSGEASSTTPKSEHEPKPYEWAKLTQEEIYMMQQQRHRKFVENQRRFSNPLPTTPPEKDSISACSASTYREAEEDSSFMVPRYSALPRTLSMVVNTSSGDSVHDDSDNQSLADSLEEHPATTVHKLYDTKQESKPVRGDASVLPEIENKFKHKQPRGRAFFVSINEPFGEGELLPSIDKIPEPPEKIKDRIYERHLKICKKHNRNMEIEKAEEERRRKEMEESLTRRKIKKEEKKAAKVEEMTARVEKKVNRSLQTKMEKPKIESNKTRKLSKIKLPKSSKIPVPVNNNHSTSTSPEREEKTKRPNKKLPKFKERPKVEEAIKKQEPTPKPQAVIHPSQMPITEPTDFAQRRLSLVSSLESTATILKLQPLAPPKPLIINQTKRSPVMKFRQRFEVIPEERSSSLTSSAEERWSTEKSRRASLPVKLTESSTSPINPSEPPKPGKPHFRRYSLESISNLIISKLMGKPLQAISCVQRGPNNEDQQIIILSPKDALGPNGTSNERDALLAMNREDFDRLSKGWMNFYILKENSDTEDDQTECRNGHCEKENTTYTLSDFQKVEKEVADVIHERSAKFFQDNTDPKTDSKNISSYSIFLKSQEKTDEDVKTSEFVLIEKAENHELMCLNNKDEDKKDEDSQKPKKEKKVTKKLDENVRFHCSNTILQTTKPIDVPPRNLSAERRQSSLPELKVTTPKHPVVQKMKSSIDILPRVSGKPSDQDGMDSDSTVYLQPPNPKIPPLTLEGSGDFPSDGTISSTSSESENETKAPIAPLPVKYLPLRKRGVSSRTRLKRETFYYDSPQPTKPDTGWTVTVAGTVELTRAAPDVEMRLSFPINSTRPPAASQSDSGFAEDANSSQNLDNPKLKKQSTVLPPTNVKQKWTVTVKKPCQGNLQEGNKLKTKKNYRLLPDLGQPPSRSSKKVLKNTTPRSEKDKETVERKLCAIWPKVQEIIKNEMGSHNARLVNELSKVYEDDLHLSVQGSAVPFEKKPRVPTMTERDLSRGLTSRSNRSKS